MQLVMVRHGQSTWNVERLLQGQVLHVPLTERGRDQVRAAAAEVARRVAPGTPVLSSDQLRARQSARIVADALGVQPSNTALLREQDVGRLQGLSLSLLEPEPVPDGLDVTEVAWGGGESIRDVHRRCGLLLDELAGRPEEPALVLVGHGDALRVLLTVLDGRGHREVDWNLTLANGQVVEREWSPEAWRRAR